MITILTVASHTGKTLLAQKILERCGEVVTVIDSAYENNKSKL